jgi:hypothetical protein
VIYMAAAQTAAVAHRCTLLRAMRPEGFELQGSIGLQ